MAPRIDCLIFSKDRAAQLELLLRSIERFAHDLYRSVAVLAVASGPAFEDGYALLAEDYPWFPIRWQNLDFEADVRAWLDVAGEVISFLVDDDVFYRAAGEPEILPWSYRGGDYDYPFSVDGNVYAKADVVKLLAGLRFRDPSELEAFAHEHRRRLPFSEVAHGEPCLVGMPANRVSVSSGMPHAGVPVAWLNERYLDGWRIPFPPDRVYGAHAEPEQVFDWLAA